MGRRSVSVFILLICCIPFVACGSAGVGAAGKAAQSALSASFVLDVEATGQRLLDELEYRDSLEELDPVVICALLGLYEADIDEMSGYFSSGATAEEILVFKAAGDESLETLRAAVQARVEDQKSVYVSYAPEEVVYLGGAVIQERGQYLIYCVAADAQKAADLVRTLLTAD